MTRLGVGSAGSSPLTRGKQIGAGGGDRSTGLIPAHAGKTAARPRSASHRRGSSPLTRGKLRDQLRAIFRHGLIPAHAGKTSPVGGGSTWNRAHPRSRGENFCPRFTHLSSEGSSPLTRGKPTEEDPHPYVLGLIPAHAGKTVGGALRFVVPGAHPRSRGENSTIAGGMAAVRGSSPLTRGKHSAA